MSEQTPGTSQDPSQSGEGDSDQLPKEDTLEDRGVDDFLAESYSPPERDPLRDEPLSEEEQIEGEEHSERIDAEAPEIWEDGGEQRPPERDPNRAGRLEGEKDDSAPAREQSTVAEDAGVAGGAASAEEGAVRLEDEEETPGLTDEPPD